MSEKYENQKTEYIHEPKQHSKHTNHEIWETNEWKKVLSIYEMITKSTNAKNN